jgi:cytochrome c oxidase subunit II
VRRVARLGALGLVAATVAACLPAPATSQARAVSDLWTIFLVAGAGVGALVWGLITFSIVRYRRRAGRAPDATTPSDAPRLEIAWTVGPILLVLVLFAATLGTLGKVDATSANSVRIDVQGFRWQWRFDYTGRQVSVIGDRDHPAEMVVPVGVPIHVHLTATDVVHSFYVPAFLFKRDAIPGHPNDFEFTVDAPGAYAGQCAEFCGVFHDRMTLTVRALDQAAFDAWLQSAAAGTTTSTEPSPS